jgi:hypothetical protein
MIVKEPESTQPESGREHWLDKEEEEIPEPVIAKAQQPYTPIVSTPDYSSVLVPLAVTQENEPEYIFKFDEDDMRKAVIYSEILNRKYI